MSKDSNETIAVDPSIDRTTQPDKFTGGKMHFIAIGGAGMSSIAQIYREQDFEVQGSDIEDSEKLADLRGYGIATFTEQSASNITPDIRTVVVSSAIKKDNPEVIEAYRLAREGQLEVIHRSDALARLFNQSRGIAVAGAHGKTTTTSMIVHILRELGFDPSFAIGASVVGPDGALISGGHAGKDDLFVIEADESDGSFLKYRPDVGVVTNVEAEHLDHWGSAAAFDQAFAQFAANSQNLVACADDPGCQRVFTDATFYTSAQFNGTIELPGSHNRLNALAAANATVLIGAASSVEQALSKLQNFRGAERRFQLKSVVSDIVVIDDYSHHPTEIDALLNAAREAYPRRPIKVLFQPHLFSRTEIFQKEFAVAFDGVDVFIQTGIFPARELQEDFPNVTSQTIPDAGLTLTNSQTIWVGIENRATAAQVLSAVLHAGDLALVVGAGSITEQATQVVDLLKEKFKN